MRWLRGTIALVVSLIAGGVAYWLGIDRWEEASWVVTVVTVLPLTYAGLGWLVPGMAAAGDTDAGSDGRRTVEAALESGALVLDLGTPATRIVGFVKGAVGGALLVVVLLIGVLGFFLWVDLESGDDSALLMQILMASWSWWVPPVGCLVLVAALWGGVEDGGQGVLIVDDSGITVQEWTLAGRLSWSHFLAWSDIAQARVEAIGLIVDKVDGAEVEVARIRGGGLAAAEKAARIRVALRRFADDT